MSIEEGAAAKLQISQQEVELFHPLVSTVSQGFFSSELKEHLLLAVVPRPGLLLVHFTLQVSADSSLSCVTF